MKAWVLYGLGDLRFEDVLVPILKPGEALVKVKCAGICSSDVPRVYTTGAYHYPIILGHEFSGVVVSVHDEKDVAWVGRRVAAYPLLPCFHCESCETGQYETCSDYRYIGSRQNGAFAEFVAAPVWNLLELPQGVDFVSAALFEPTAVALHAAKMPDWSCAKSAAVIGAGTIGRLIVEWLKIYGVERIALIGRNSPNVSADVCFEATGSESALARCIECTRPNGQVVQVGNPNADFCIGQKDYWRVLRKQLKIQGAWNSRFPDDWRELTEHAERKNLPFDALHIETLRFDCLDSAIARLRDKTAEKFKAILAFD